DDSAVPARPANKSAVMTGPSSFRSENAANVPTESSALNRARLEYPCSPRTPPTNRPHTMMMTRDSAPALCTWWTTSRNRLTSTVGEFMSSRRKKICSAPKVRTNPLKMTYSSRSMLPDLLGVTAEQLLGVVRCGIVKRHRPVGHAVHELPYHLGARVVQLVGTAGAGHLAVRDQVTTVRHGGNLLYLVADDYAGNPQRIVHFSHQAHDHA